MRGGGGRRGPGGGGGGEVEEEEEEEKKTHTQNKNVPNYLKGHADLIFAGVDIFAGHGLVISVSEQVSRVQDVQQSRLPGVHHLQELRLDDLQELTELLM